MSFEFKERIYEIIDNNINELYLRDLNKQTLNKLYNALKFNHPLKLLSLYNSEIYDILSYHYIKI